MRLGNGGAWYLMANNDVESYTFNINPAAMTYEIVKTMKSGANEYFLIGDHNGWNTTNKDFQLLANDGKTYEITLSADVIENRCFKEQHTMIRSIYGPSFMELITIGIPNSLRQLLSMAVHGWLIPLTML